MAVTLRRQGIIIAIASLATEASSTVVGALPILGAPPRVSLLELVSERQHLALPLGLGCFGRDATKIGGADVPMGSLHGHLLADWCHRLDANP
jgi:hypothetical protein